MGTVVKFSRAAAPVHSALAESAIMLQQAWQEITASIDLLEQALDRANQLNQQLPLGEIRDRLERDRCLLMAKLAACRMATAGH